MENSWIPDPTRTTNRSVCFGGLNISPWTNFHPVSSIASSGSSSRVYLAMSRLKDLIIIMLRMPARKKTTTSELMIENQWIWTSVIFKYESHLDAHGMSLSIHSTEYVITNSFLFGSFLLIDCILASSAEAGSWHVLSALTLILELSIFFVSISKPTTRNKSLVINCMLKLLKLWLTGEHYVLGKKFASTQLPNFLAGFCKSHWYGYHFEDLEELILKICLITIRHFVRKISCLFTTTSVLTIFS